MTDMQIQSTFIKDIMTGILLYILIISAMYMIPLTSVATWLFLPLPVLFYRLKTGRKGGMLIMLTSLAILMLVTRNIAAITFYFGSLLMTGFVLGECIEKYFPVGKIMLFTCLIVFGSCLAGIFLYSLIQGQEIQQLISGYVSNYYAMSGEFFSELERVYPEMNFDRQMFEKENEECKYYAYQQMGGQQAEQREQQNAAAHAVIGALIGVASGGLIGAGVGHAGAGAGIGAGSGLIAGSASGAAAASRSSGTLQNLYDNAYIQCHYAKGNQVASQR